MNVNDKRTRREDKREEKVHIGIHPDEKKHCFLLGNTGGERDMYYILGSSSSTFEKKEELVSVSIEVSYPTFNGRKLSYFQV